MTRPILPPWLRRGLEAAVVAAIVAIASLAGDRLGTAGVPHPIPPGPAGALVLAPAVLAIAVITTTYPIAMAATRGDAVLGALAAYLVASDLTVIFTGGPVSLDRAGIVLPGGVLVALLALVPALAAVAGAQVGAALGFGRRSGATAAVVAAVAAAIVLVIVGLAA